jgi:hypothetical protein
MSATTNNFFLVKKEWPEIFHKKGLIAIISIRPEPGPDLNIVCATRPGLGLVGPRPRSHADLYHHPHFRRCGSLLRFLMRALLIFSYGRLKKILFDT